MLTREQTSKLQLQWAMQTLGASSSIMWQRQSCHGLSDPISLDWVGTAQSQSRKIQESQLNSPESKWLVHLCMHLRHARTHAHTPTHLPEPAALQHGESGSEQF